MHNKVEKRIAELMTEAAAIRDEEQRRVEYISQLADEHNRIMEALGRRKTEIAGALEELRALIDEGAGEEEEKSER